MIGNFLLKMKSTGKEHIINPSIEALEAMEDILEANCLPAYASGTRVSHSVASAGL